MAARAAVTKPPAPAPDARMAHDQVARRGCGVNQRGTEQSCPEIRPAGGQADGEQHMWLIRGCSHGWEGLSSASKPRCPRHSQPPGPATPPGSDHGWSPGPARSRASPPHPWATALPRQPQPLRVSPASHPTCTHKTWWSHAPASPVSNAPLPHPRAQRSHLGTSRGHGAPMLGTFPFLTIPTPDASSSAHSGHPPSAALA